MKVGIARRPSSSVNRSAISALGQTLVVKRKRLLPPNSAFYQNGAYEQYLRRVEDYLVDSWLRRAH